MYIYERVLLCKVVASDASLKKIIVQCAYFFYRLYINTGEHEHRQLGWSRIQRTALV